MSEIIALQWVEEFFQSIVLHISHLEFKTGKVTIML